MSQWVKVATVDEVAPGCATEKVAGDNIVALFRVGETFYALDGVCPHAGGPLGKGSVVGNTVTCPWHGWQFDVTTGQHCLNARIQHGKFPVEVRGEELFVEIP